MINFYFEEEQSFQAQITLLLLIAGGPITLGKEMSEMGPALRNKAKAIFATFLLPDLRLDIS